MNSADLVLLLVAVLIQGIMIGLVLCKRFPELFSVRALMRVINPGGVVVESPAERQRRVNELWSNLAHDLRTPMTSVRGYIETAQMRLADSDKGAVDSALATALRNTETVVRLAEEMFALARLEERPLELAHERVDLVDLVCEVRDRCRPLADKQQLNLEVHFPSHDLLLRGERRLIERAVENLIQNSIRYTNPGGFVSVQLNGRLQEVQVAVVDSGEGIPENEIPRILDRFYRVDKERSGRERGFGLGLAITREVVVRHKGRIEIQSTVGSGTVVALIFPAEAL